MPVTPEALDAAPTKSVESIKRDALPGGSGASEVEKQKLLIGGYVVGGLLILIFAILLLIAVYAWFTKPEIQEAKDLAPKNIAATYKEQRTAWFTEIKDLIQVLVVSLFVPLLGTVIGYLFGRQQQANSSD